jgi:cytochrome P450
MYSSYLIVVGVAVVFVSGINYLRMCPGGIFWLYQIRGYLLRIPVYSVEDPDLMAAILRQSDIKGPFLEQVVAIPAWLPIRSVESTDGDEWKTLRAQFDNRLSRLSQRTLSILVEQTVTKLRCVARLDYETLALSLAKVLLAWVSQNSLSDVPETLAALLVASTREWKRSITLRAQATRSIQVEFVRNVVEYCAFQEENDEYVSDFIQAFLISPLINITDIFCAIQDADENITTCVLRAHPFPVLERRLVAPLGMMDKGSQVFLPLAEVARTHPTSWMVFGLGPRSCPGRGPAICILQKYKTLASLSTWCPRVGHRYSGRHNDNLSFLEGLSTLYRIGRLCLSWTRDRFSLA